MAIKVLNPENVLNFLIKTKDEPVPDVIKDLKEKIECKTKALELRQSAGEPILQNDIQDIVQMKLQLDGLYCDWAEGKL